MKRGDVHLTYCSNIHAGERWADVSRVLAESLPRVRALMGLEGPFAIGLRLSAAAARELDVPSTLAEFRAFLRAGNYYVPTLNGFPYGAFHGTRVKEQVYLPDWRSAERVDYSNRLARVLAALAMDAGLTEASVSTVPCAFKTVVQSETDVRQMVTNLVRHAAYLASVRQATGVTVTLALEPEPACYLETAADAIVFFRSYLFDPAYLRGVAQEAGVEMTVETVATHVGVCLDACHMAVEFEDPAQAVAQVMAAGIRIGKVQLSSAIRLTSSTPTSPSQVLGRFAEDTYLHQVVTSDTAGLTKYVDLPDALAAAGRAPSPSEWRVHFHVPIFLAQMSGFETTQAYLASLIQVIQQRSASTCLEVETYTWDVLPVEYRTTDVCTAIARELTWARGVLGW